MKRYTRKFPENVSTEMGFSELNDTITQAVLNLNNISLALRNGVGIPEEKRESLIQRAKGIQLLAKQIETHLAGEPEELGVE